MRRIYWKISFILGFFAFIDINLAGKLFANNNRLQWQPIGVDKYGNITKWINLSSHKTLNKDSFRIQVKLEEENKQILGRLDINCRNRDYYLRKRRQMSQHETWKSIPEGSSFEETAKFYCKKTSAASKWGYTADTKYLWDVEKPISPAHNHKGDWISLYKNSSREFRYNSNIKKAGDYILAAYFYKKYKQTKNSPYISTASNYGWIVVSCKSNLHSIFKEFKNSIYGEWMPPKTGPIGGGAWGIRKAECNY